VIQPLLEPSHTVETITLHHEPDQWIVRSNDITVKIFPDGQVTVVDQSRIQFDLSDWMAAGTSLFGKIATNAGERVFGLGEKTGNLDKRGRLWTQWTTDVHPHTPATDAMYQAIPVMVMSSSAGSRGLFLANTYRTYFELRNPDTYIVGADDGPLSLYLYLGPTVQDVLNQHINTTGHPFLPPRWALGFQQSRYSYATQSRVEQIAHEFRKRQIPLDVIYLDIDYMDGYRLFTWDSNRFPDPTGLLHQLAEQGIRVVTIIDPGVKFEETYPVYQSGEKIDAFIRYANGEPFRSQVWPGMCVFPDFVKESVRKWWAQLNYQWVQQGVAGIWNDMNEPALFGYNPQVPIDGGHASDAGIIHKADTDEVLPHIGIHNTYALLQANATIQGLSNDTNRRPFLLSRAGFAGIQRWAAVWTGDNSSWWEHLAQSIPMCLNLGLSGVPFVGPDIGGFFGAPSQELFVRWIQAGVFYPFVRIHTDTGTPDQEPWSFGADVEEIARQYIRFRYRLLPYLETLFEEAHRTGAPIMRPMFWHFPSDDQTYDIEDQFLLGPNLLIAPITEPKARRRMIYLPSTDWYEPATQTLLGPGWHIVEAPLERIPVFVRSGGIIPLGPEVDSTARLESQWPQGQDGPDEFFVIRGTGDFTCYSDDGQTFSYKNGQFRRIRVTVQTTSHSTLINVTGHWIPSVPDLTKRHRFLVAPYSDPPENVTLNGMNIPWSWDPEHAVVELTLPEPLSLGRPLNIEIKNHLDTTLN